MLGRTQFEVHSVWMLHAGALRTPPANAILSPPEARELVVALLALLREQVNGTLACSLLAALHAPSRLVIHHKTEPGWLHDVCV